MTPEQWQEVKSVLAQVLEMATSERAAYLETVYADRPEIRADIDSLMQSYEEDSSFLSEPAAAQFMENRLTGDSVDLVDRRFGPYRILDIVGEGGMGTVYRAMRSDGLYDKEVAVKIVRTGLATRYFISRFDIERRILARLDHPNIARLLDGGVSADGLPFFVLEYVSGAPIDQYCKARDLSIAARLELFRTVCAAVQYAHQNLIVHRDLKPANILVTPEGVPKLLDFGVAKVIDPQHGDNEDVTVTMLQILTPEFASPEQVRGELITIASDIYSLGVILYLLMTGVRPYQVSKSTPHQIIDTVCNAIPDKPSTAVARHAKGSSSEALDDQAPSGSDSLRLSRALSGDLDCILLKALRKEPDQRYPTVAQFSEDVRRHLEHLPVMARKGTTAYRASRFLRRHRAGVTAFVAIASILIVGAVMVVREAYIAEHRFNDVRRLANSLIFEIHDSIKDLPGSTPARKLIVDRALEYLSALSRESRGDISLERELATAYERVGLVQGMYLQNNLGDTKGSLDSYQRAFALRKQIADKTGEEADRLALAQGFRLVADQQWALGDSANATKSIYAAVALADQLNKLHPNQWDTLHELSFDYELASLIEAAHYGSSGGDPAKREDDCRKAVAIDEIMLQMRPGDIRTLDGYAIDLSDFAGIIRERDPAGALKDYEKYISIEDDLRHRSNETRYARGLAGAYGEIGGFYDSTGDHTRALEYDRKCMEIDQQLMTVDPKNAVIRKSTAVAYANVAIQLHALGRHAESVDPTQKSLELMRGIVASDPGNEQQLGSLAQISINGAFNFLGAGRLDLAMKELDEGCAIFDSLKKLHPNDPNVIPKEALCNVTKGDVAQREGNARQAGDFYRRGLELVDPAVNSNSRDRSFWFAAADAYAGLGDLSRKSSPQNGPSSGLGSSGCAEARAWYEKSLAGWAKIDHPEDNSPLDFQMGSPDEVRKKLLACEASRAK